MPIRCARGRMQTPSLRGAQQVAQMSGSEIRERRRGSSRISFHSSGLRQLFVGSSAGAAERVMFPLPRNGGGIELSLPRRRDVERLARDGGAECVRSVWRD